MTTRIEADLLSAGTRGRTVELQVTPDLTWSGSTTDGTDTQVFAWNSDLADMLALPNEDASPLDDLYNNYEGADDDLFEMLMSRALESVPTGDVQEACFICLEAPGAELQWVRTHACGHLFHDVCVRSWFANHTTCPTCRAVAIGVYFN